MKRFHVHVAVDDLDANIRFYSTLFGTPPTVHKPDYAKWMLDDPRVNFAISKRGLKPGVDHLGVQVKSGADLATLREQVAAAEIAALDQPNTLCCYARSERYRVGDVPHARFSSCLRWCEKPAQHLLRADDYFPPCKVWFLLCVREI